MLLNQVPKKEREQPELGREVQPCLSPELSELRAYQTYVQMCSRIIGPLYTPPAIEQWRANQSRLFTANIARVAPVQFATAKHRKRD
jgi:hypothetical protein